MFFLDKKTASAVTLGNVEQPNIVVWRWLARGNFFVNEAGEAIAKSTAFDIRRDNDDNVKEPSASLFQMRNNSESTQTSSATFLKLLVDTKRFKSISANSASGTICTDDVKEIEKDPKAFWLAVSAEQRKGDEFIHWDLGYVKDDRDKEMQDAKTALAMICKVHLQLQHDGLKLIG